nr:SpoIIIAH-like family protein [Clostridia bacterium]
MNTSDEKRRPKELESDITENDIIADADTEQPTAEPETTVKPRRFAHFDLTPLKKIISKIALRLSGVKARPVVIGVSAVIVGLAVWFNWMLFSDDGSGTDVSDISENEVLLGQSVYVAGDAEYEEDSYFAMSQLSRQRARDEALEVLQLVIDDESALKEVKDRAYADANRMASEIASEANIETLVMAKGFEECVAVISNKNANIIVKSQGLLQNEIAQIKEIVYEQAGIHPVNIKIIEKN